jgi:hypothetical protein
MFRLYVKCPNCNNNFPSGFKAESATQLMGFSYLCQKCLSIVPCPASNYSRKVNEHFENAIKKEEIFALPKDLKRVELSGYGGEDLHELDKEITVPPGVLMTSYRVFVVFRGKTGNDKKP